MRPLGDEMMISLDITTDYNISSCVAKGSSQRDIIHFHALVEPTEVYIFSDAMDMAALRILPQICLPRP